jgi:glycosyltransferase involved in cell wall biosynthesis
MKWAAGFRKLIIPGGYSFLSGMPFDHARNVACEQALSSGCEYIYFLDSDVIPPHDAILRLMAHKKPIVSGLYCRRSPPKGIPVMIKDGQWITNFPQNSLIEVDLVGAGCLLIHRNLLERFPGQRPGKRWFDWRVDMKGQPGFPDGTCLSEDFTFNRAIKEKLGISTYVDTSVICQHVGFAQAGIGTFEPAEHNA